MNADDLTDRLARELHDRAGEMDGSMLGLAGVQGRARTIRRRRTATAVVSVAAAVAVIVPTAALATHVGGTPEPGPITSLSPTPTPSGTAEEQPPPEVLDVSQLPTGAAPATDYVENGVFHATDGSSYEVGTRFTPSQFVELADGSVVWRTSDRNGHLYVEIRDPDGTYSDPVRTTSDLSVNAAHSIVAWLTPTNQVTIWEGWASRPRPLGAPVPGTDVRIGPVTGSADATPGQAGPDCRQSSCTVIVNVNDQPFQPWEVSESGSQPLRDGGYLVVKDQSQAGLTVGLTKVDDTGSCSALLGGGEFRGFTTCDNQLVSFSPDGQLVEGLPAQGDGLGPNGIAMYDLQGKVLFERRATLKAQSYFLGETWEDATHLLLPAFQDGTWSVVRIASDGSMEYAVTPAGGALDGRPFLLPTGGGLPG